MTEKSLITQDSMAVPAFLHTEDTNLDAMNIDKSEMKIAALSLCQSTTSAVQDGKAQMGDFIDSITEENFGNEVEIIVVKRDKMWAYYPDAKAKKEGKKTKYGHDSTGTYWDDETKITAEEKWQCAVHNFLVVMPGNLSPLPNRFSFRSTAYKEGSNLLNQIARFAKMKKVPVNGLVFKLKSEITAKDGNKWASPIVTFSRFATKEEFDFTNPILKEFLHKEIGMDDADSSDPTGQEAGSEDLNMD